MALMIAMGVLRVTTQLVHIPVRVTQELLEMGKTVQVHYNGHQTKLEFKSKMA